jgi:hypothetical protein
MAPVCTLDSIDGGVQRLDLPTVALRTFPVKALKARLKRPDLGQNLLQLELLVLGRAIHPRQVERLEPV